MTKKTIEVQKYDFLPVTPERWDDLAALFGSNASCAGCWCMWWRMTNRDFVNSGKEGRKNGLRTIVQQGVEAGILAYADGIPAGWVALAPRLDYPRLATSKLLAPVDDQPVWSMPCFFVHRNYRHTGMLGRLIHAGVEYAAEHGARIVEAYPCEPHEKVSTMSIYTGVTTVFIREGFVEVARRKETRPIMRKEV